MPTEQHFQSGAILDTRPDIEKAQDFKLTEMVASANPVKWVEKKESEWRKFPIFDQNGSGSCVAQTMAKLLGILYWLKNQVYVHFSATHIYQRRANRPSDGMAGVDAFSIAQSGVTLEVLVPSQKMTDAEMDNTVVEQYKRDVGGIFKIGNYVQLPVADIETVASVIQTTGKAVMVWFYFSSGLSPKEWTDVPEVKYPKLKLTDPKNVARHSVTAVDFTLYKGKKALIIEDSWGQDAGSNGRRIVTEDFFNARNWFVAYPIDFKFDTVVNPTPVYFTIPCRFIDDPALSASEKRRIDSMQHDEVVRIQKYLQDRGFFPTNIETTGYYGAITAKAILAWQVANQVDSYDTLQNLKGWFWGAKSIAKANQS